MWPRLDVALIIRGWILLYLPRDPILSSDFYGLGYWPRHGPTFYGGWSMVFPDLFTHNSFAGARDRTFLPLWMTLAGRWTHNGDWPAPTPTPSMKHTPLSLQLDCQELSPSLTFQPIPEGLWNNSPQHRSRPGDSFGSRSDMRCVDFRTMSV